MRIVVVEDEVKIRQGIINLMHKHTSHHVVGEAANGLIGLNVIEETKPDLIVTDIKMPELNGIKMIEELRKRGINAYVVILTGFSEFEYAQKAVKFGVCEYMLKPITAEDLISVLNYIEKKIGAEESLKYKHEIAEQDILHKIITTSAPTEEMVNYVNTMFEANDTTEFIAVMINLERVLDEKRAYIKMQISKCLDAIQGIKYYITEQETSSELFVIIKKSDSTCHIERIIQMQIIEPLKIKDIKHSVWAVTKFLGLRNADASIRKLRALLIWSVVFGEDYLLSTQKIKAIDVKTPKYSSKLENKMKKALCNMEEEKLRQCTQEFTLALKNELYDPVDIIERYTRYLAAILSIVKETNNTLYEQIEKDKPIQRIREGRSLNELDQILENLIINIIHYNKKSDITNYVVGKAVNYIKEHYNEGISLDELAQLLGITPVYLSSQFNKEVGINFTQYIKELRMNKAKQLLLTTDIKLYAIGESVGYQDPKYFCRVFKEVCGISPKIYREISNKRT